MSRDSIVGTATDYGLNDKAAGVKNWYGQEFSLLHVVQTGSGAHSLLSNGYRGIFPRGKSDRGVKLTTHLHLVPRSRKREPIHPLLHMSP
jgi:hypothetical protein